MTVGIYKLVFEMVQKALAMWFEPSFSGTCWVGSNVVCACSQRPTTTYLYRI